MRIKLAILLALIGLAPSARAEDPVPEPSPAAAEMLQSMREKGILSEQEYSDLYRRQAKYEEERRLNESLPGWIQDWTFGGDARMRYEHIQRGDLDLNEPLDPNEDAIDLITLKAKGNEDRYRTRFRIGAEKRIDEGVIFGFQIATATEFSFSTEFADSLVLADTKSFGRTILDHRSQNENFDGYFQPLEISLSRIYIDYTPTFAPALNLVIGKFANPFVSKYWRDGDRLVWDPDINPSGVALSYRFDAIPETLWVESSAGAFILDQNNAIDVQCTTADETTCQQFFPVPDDADPFMLGGQIGISGRPRPSVQLGLRGSYYDYQHIGVQDAALLLDLGNGGDVIDGNLLDLIDGADARIQQGVVDVYAQLTPFGEKWPITPFAQYTTLLSASSEANGYGIGFSVGNPYEFAKLVVLWSYLERNSTLAIFTDSDLNDGFTNAKGWFIGLERQLTQHIKVGVSYNVSQLIDKNCAAFKGPGTEVLCDAGSSEVLGGLIAQFRKNSQDRSRLQVDMTVEF